jgi:hypothetical protein
MIMITFTTWTWTIITCSVCHVTHVVTGIAHGIAHSFKHFSHRLGYLRRYFKSIRHDVAYGIHNHWAHVSKSSAVGDGIKIYLVHNPISHFLEHFATKTVDCTTI